VSVVRGPAVGIFLWSRAAIWAGALFAWLVFEPNRHPNAARWDDPTLTFSEGHPVIFAGAGSHASYFEPGEYVTPVPLPPLRPIRGALEGLRRMWRDVLRQDDPGDLGAKVESALSIPFVDYARGDGIAVGPGGATGAKVAPEDQGVLAVAVTGTNR